MPIQDDKPEEFGKAPGRDNSTQGTGEFTRAFRGRTEPAKPPSTPNDPSVEDSPSPAPGSLTQPLGGKSKQPAPPPPDKPDSPRSAIPHALESRPVDSFTKAFDGVNAFTRNPADLGEFHFSPEAGKQPPSEATPSESPGSFTRLFGSGEGVLTPSGTDERPRSPATQYPKLDPSRPTGVEPGSFTEAFRAQSAPESPESKAQRGSFTEEFGAPPSWSASEPLPPSTPDRTYPSRPGSGLPTYNPEPVLPSNPQRPPAVSGFDRLINPLSNPLSSEPAPASDATRTVRLPEPPLPDTNYAPRASSPAPGATVVFSPSRQPEQEVDAPRGKSEYTMVVERSKLRPPVEVPGTGGLPSGAGASAAPPNLPQYPPMPQPVAPAWPPMPTVAPAPPWQPPQLTPPAMPQAPSLSAPALPLKPPSLGDQLVSLLPFMLALTVINFLGLLAVLIILFATRK